MFEDIYVGSLSNDSCYDDFVYHLIVERLPIEMVTVGEHGSFIFKIASEKDQELLEKEFDNVYPEEVVEYIQELGGYICEQCLTIYDRNDHANWQPEELKDTICPNCTEYYVWCEDLKCVEEKNNCYPYEDGYDVLWYSEDHYCDNFSGCENCQETYPNDDIHIVQVYNPKEQEFETQYLCEYCLKDSDDLIQSWLDKGSDEYYPFNFMVEVDGEYVTPFEACDDKLVATCAVTDELCFVEDMKYISAYGMVGTDGQYILEFKRNPIFEGYGLTKLPNDLWAFRVSDHIAIQENYRVVLDIPNVAAHVSIKHDWQELLDFAIELRKRVRFEEIMPELCYQACNAKRLGNNFSFENLTEFKEQVEQVREYIKGKENDND